MKDKIGRKETKEETETSAGTTKTRRGKQSPGCSTQDTYRCRAMCKVGLATSVRDTTSKRPAGGLESYSSRYANYQKAL
jgi:hypothetical protein